MEPITWLGDRVRILDQTLLPHGEVYLQATHYREMAEAIGTLRVRGAPLIGIAAAYGLALAALRAPQEDMASFLRALEEAAATLRATRPTGVNLSWALARLLARAQACRTPQEAQEALVAEAQAIHREQAEADRALARHGAALLPQGAAVLTHCNTGALATGGYGTALGIIREAWERGHLSHVYCTETRPLLQGARLTTWELLRWGIPCTLITEGAAGHILRRGLVQAVVVGADRIAANGDVANKVGTYVLAVLAREHGVPFYVAAPLSTVDLACPSGEAIPIEERSPQEVRTALGTPIAPAEVPALNPAFDVTPASLVTAIITERGVARPPYQGSLPALALQEVAHD